MLPKILLFSRIAKITAKNNMKGIKKKMSGKEWREFSRDIFAGIFGGIVVLAWAISYDALKNEPILMRIILPFIPALLLLIILIFLLRYLLLEKQ